MNSLRLTDKPKDLHLVVTAKPPVDSLEEPWFAEPPPSSRVRASAPVPVGDFLGDPEVDAWLR
ncbi:MAG: hypothetical protein KF764_32420 [Labilithrix sp.]|nr:hypothetical protein [Labilithrix sp.]